MRPLLEVILCDAEYLSDQNDKSMIGFDEFKISFEKLVLYMKQHDIHKKNIEIIATKLNINIEILNTKRNEYLNTIRYCDKLFNQPRRQLSKELQEFLVSLNLDLILLPLSLSKQISSTRLFSFQNAIFLKNELSKNIFGQDRAIDIISDAFKDDLLIDDNKPRNVFFFLGPSGSGKTFLANKLTESVNEYKYKIFNMSQYSFPSTDGDLSGTHRMWGNTKVGTLTSFVRQYPKSIILFDEFEKSHADIQNALLTILSDGYLDDACGWCKDGMPYHKDREDDEDCQTINSIFRVDFTQTILIFTSNIGSKLYNDHRFIEMFDTNSNHLQQLLYDLISNETISEMKSDNNSSKTSRKAILPHFLSRLMQGELILFNKLALDDYLKIVDKEYNKLQNLIKDKYQITMKCSQEDLNYLYKFLILQLSPSIDARSISIKSSKLLYNDILEHIEKSDQVIENIKKITIIISKKTKNQFDKEFNSMVKDNTLIQYFFRKNLTFKFESNVNITKNILNYQISNIYYHKINSIADFQGEDALVFEVPDLSFEDIAGHNKVKERLKEIVKYLKDPKHLELFKVESPKGLLMYGKPGTGKTMLAQAFAHEADLPIIQTTGTKLLDLSHMKNIYKKAREYAPSIIFIDEIDAIGKRDGNTLKDAIINNFLTEINGFNDNSKNMVFTIAATNFKEKLDSAILRSGRIDLHVHIDSLDKKAREFFVKKLLEKPNDESLDKDKILLYTAGMTGADLEKVMRESSLEALRQKNNKITQEIVIEQINIIKYGQRVLEKSIDLILEETAYHEAGHAVISKILMPQIKIEQITITSREDTLGFVSFDSEQTISNPSKKDLENKICIAFAGRIAQIKQFSTEGFDTGASSDLEKATKYAYLIAAHFGMDEDIGYINIDGIPNLQYKKNKLTNSSFLQTEIEVSVKQTIQKMQEKTQNIVEENWKTIDTLAKLLIKNEVLEEEELNTILK